MYYEKTSETEWTQYAGGAIYSKFTEHKSNYDKDKKLSVVLKRSDGLHVQLKDGGVWWGWTINNMTTFIKPGRWHLANSNLSKIFIIY